MLENAALLRRSMGRLTRRLRTEARERESEISPTKLSILGYLHREGPMTPSALAAAEAVQPQSLTRVLAELEAEGLMTRRQDTADRRQFLLEMTVEGREVLRRDVTTRALWLDAAMDAQLSPTEQEMLRLAAQLMDRLADAPFGLRLKTIEDTTETTREKRMTE